MKFGYFPIFFLLSLSVLAQEVLPVSENSSGRLTCPTGYEKSGAWCYDREAIWQRENQELNKRQEEAFRSIDRDIANGKKQEMKEAYSEFIEELENLRDTTDKEQKNAKAQNLAKMLERRIESRTKVPPDTCLEDFINTSSGYIDSLGIHSLTAGLLPGDLVLEQDGNTWPTDKYTSIKKGQKTTFRVERGYKTIQVTFECPYSSGEHQEKEVQLLEAIQEERWDDCISLGKTYEEMNGRGQFTHQFEFYCRWVHPEIELTVHDIFEYDRLDLRYSSFDLERLESTWTSNSSYRSSYREQGMHEYDRAITRQYKEAKHRLEMRYILRR